MANKKYYISDTHFGHKKIMHMSPRLKNYADDYKELEEMIIDNWNNKVEPGDLVYHLGDFMFYKTPEEAEELIKKLNGQIYLILGNHDSSSIFNHPRVRRLLANVTKNIIEVKDGNDRIILSHYPMWDWKGMWRDSLHFYGHVHHQNNLQLPNSLYVGIENIHIQPIDLEEAKYFMEIYRAYNYYKIRYVTDNISIINSKEKARLVWFFVVANNQKGFDLSNVHIQISQVEIQDGNEIKKLFPDKFDTRVIFNTNNNIMYPKNIFLDLENNIVTIYF